MQKNTILRRKNPICKTLRARELRQKSTIPEKILWEHLRGHRLCNLHFRRQAIIAPYIIDFFCTAALLAIEVDGTIHQTQKGMDKARDKYLTSLGIQVLHISNEQVLNQPDSVIQVIVNALKSRNVIP